LPLKDPIVMKRINSLVLGAVAAIYLSLWVYQIGYEHGRTDVVDDIDKKRHELTTKIAMYDRQIQNLNLISANP